MLTFPIFSLQGKGCPKPTATDDAEVRADGDENTTEGDDVKGLKSKKSLRGSDPVDGTEGQDTDMVEERCKGKGKKGCDEVAEVAEADEDDESETLLVRAENEAGMDAPCKGKGCPKSGAEEVFVVVPNGESGEEMIACKGRGCPKKCKGNNCNEIANLAGAGGAEALAEAIEEPSKASNTSYETEVSICF